MRISGLVRICTNVQSQLRSGIRPEATLKFRQYVLSAVNQVELLCSGRGATPDALPTPSRNAYWFLKNLDLDNLPISYDLPPLRKRASVKNVVRSANNFSSEMWETLDELVESESALKELHFGLEVVVDAIESVCKSQGSDVYGMADRSKCSFFWMKFLTLEENLRAHINALRVGRYTALEEGLAVEIHLGNQSKSLYSIMDKGDRLLITAHEGFIHADQEIWRRLARLMHDQTSISKNAVLAFAEQSLFKKVSGELISMMCGCQKESGKGT